MSGSPPRSGPSRAEGLARIRLLRSPGVGPGTYTKLLARFGSAQAALEALPALERTSPAAGRGQFSTRPLASTGQVDDEIAKVLAVGGRYVFHDSRDYPAALTQALEAGWGAPPILTVRGRMALAAGCPVALVGARNASQGGLRLARELAHDLAEAGYGVVSGLARGVDAAAHRGALAAGAAGTIGVLPCGINLATPPEHAELIEQMAQQGLVVSHLPPGTPANTSNFHARNRLIAAMSGGVVVVEAAQRSGALATARHAADCGREVMAMPGSPLETRCHGSNALIRDGAVLVQSAADVIETLADMAAALAEGPAPERPWPATRSLLAGDLGRQPELEPEPEPPAPLPNDLSPSTLSPSQRVLAAIEVIPMLMDDLARATGLPASAVQQGVLELELAGMVVRVSGGKVARAV